MSRRSRILAGLASAIVALLAVELGLRWVLFRVDTGVLWRLRQSRNFADMRYEETYWRLRRRLEGVPPGGPQLHPHIGWVGGQLDPLTLDHQSSDTLAGRRPLLLYGDSYARCSTPEAGCFGPLLEASELGGDLLLLNHGVPGYGLDQIWLLLDETVDRYLHERPVIAVGVFVDDDLERCLFALRQWPKPRFGVTEGVLVEPHYPLPSLRDSLSTGVDVRSYAWRYLLHGSGLVPDWLRERLSGTAELRAEARALGGALIDAICTRLDAAGAPHLFVLFHGEESLEVEGTDRDWRHAFLAAELERRGVPYISSREALRADMAATGRAPEDYFGRRGHERGHYVALGNRVVFAAIESGVAALLDGR